MKRREFCAFLASALVTPGFAFGQDRKVRVATPGPAITTLPTEIVKIKRFDKEEGIELVVTPTPGAIAVKAMVGGDFDFTLSVGSALIGAVRGAPVKVVYVHVDKWLYFLYSASNFTNIRELDGKTIAIDSAGGTLDGIVRRAVRASGASVENTAFVAMGNIGAIPGALIAGAVDAGVITPPQEVQLLRSPRKFNNLGFLGDYAPGITGGVAASNKILQESPDIVRAFLRAHAKAHQFILKNRDETIPIVSRFLNLAADEAALSYDTTLLKYYTKGGSLTKEDQAKFVAEQVRGLNLSINPDPTTFFEFSLLPENAR